MRNLRNVHRSVLASPPGLVLTASAWDPGTDSLICAYGPTKDSAFIQLKRWKSASQAPFESSTAQSASEDITAWDAPCPTPDRECDEILDLHYFTDSSISCLVLAGGDLVVVRDNPSHGEDKIEIVGSVDAGISAAAWSPDEELLAIVTAANTFLYMTKDFENVINIAFSPDDLKASKHVSVGWGKAETQFKGKKARLLRDPTIPEHIDQGSLSGFDNKNIAISWRGDGSYVAVNRIESGRRVIQVYSRDGSLDSTSEPVDGLLGALSWRPAGNLICGVQCLEDRADVVFFERNGLRHGQFSLRLTEEEMKTHVADISLKWNIDSSVLAVCFHDKAQLWTMGNYYYYLKQEIYPMSPTLDGKSVHSQWHPEEPLKFVIASPGEIQRLEYNLVVATHYVSPPHDYGIVVVIDGKCLKITPMRFASVPPPMALHELCLSENAVDVAVSVANSDEHKALIAVLHREGVTIYELDVLTKPRSPPSLKWFTKVIHPELPNVVHQQVLFSKEQTVSVLSSDLSGSAVCALDVESGLMDQDVSLFSEEVRGLVAQESHSRASLVLAKDYVIEYGFPQGGVFSKRGHLRYPLLKCSSPRVEVVSFRRKAEKSSPESDELSNYIDNAIFFGLTSQGCLFANKRLLANNCTSFLVTPAHLIFTTSHHLLKFVHMAGVEDLEVPPDTPEVDERCRSVERGAKLVAVMPSTFALMMQMPRGNLETIYPRALVLAGIRQSINDKKYDEAFVACRSQRVDMNIIHDHDPSLFLAHIGLFVDQVVKVEHIDLFLSQLREEDVSKTMYKETLNKSPSPRTIEEQSSIPNSATKHSKVNMICNTFLEALHERTSSHLQNVITAHVCKNPPDLDAGLTEISKLREHSPERVDGVVQHICFLADVNRLYDNALGIYDLQLTLLIAQQSQKDPREYLPFLQNLQNMTSLRRQYSIDNHLGRHRKALDHLYEMNVFDEVKAYTEKHSLFTEAMDLYRYQEDHLIEIMRMYADYLHKIGNFKEAGITYEYVHDNTAASESYCLAHLWKESISCAATIPLTTAEFQSLAHKLAEAQIESKDFFSAATIHLNYLSDVPNATRLFCQGYYFADAIRTASLHQRSDLLSSTVDTGLIDGLSSTTELLADCKSQLGAQVPRIKELRLKKAEDPLAFLEGDPGPGAADIPDNISLAPTDVSTMGGGSLFTRYTNRSGTTTGTNATRTTSKNRRREERKRARGKKGSVYEEEYLVNSVARLVQRVNSVGDEVGRLTVGLMRRGMRERARAVDAAMEDLVALCRNAVAEVFCDGVGLGGGVEGRAGARAGGNEPNFAGEFTQNSPSPPSPSPSSGILPPPQPPPLPLAGSNPSPQQPPTPTPIPIPLVKPFERLSLFGSKGSKGAGE